MTMCFICAITSTRADRESARARLRRHAEVSEAAMTLAHNVDGNVSFVRTDELRPVGEPPAA
jgi:hypothetical protein